MDPAIAPFATSRAGTSSGRRLRHRVAGADLADERAAVSLRLRRRRGADRGAVGTHFAPKAKQVIYLFMAGAPSQLDLFDHKPKLQKHDGQEIPAGIILEGRAVRVHQGHAAAARARHSSFAQHGQSGSEISELLPHPAAASPTTSRSSGR